ncbi:hypothetical protein CC78DRAFT_620263 [Lojkania enalia]|uniref:Uncharacterized protein n=1 Tax=Lojkania enalia TaxID=147567 RepID=A0A9P4K3Z0_9PLEO|nr:hypothetical protein CC78DRAFT_620263 [Didymosphaeria enalia]
MPSRVQPTLRTLLRTSILRPQTATQLPRTLPQQHSRRSASPRPINCPHSRSLSTSSTQWTRSTTPYSLSSVRTFTRASARRRPNEEPISATTDPEAAKMIEEVIEQIQDLYGTARDEFEMASEETEKNTTYAEGDRAAAREELSRLLEYYNGVLEGADRAVSEEVKRRVGQRIRELEQAVIAMEDAASHGD